jgi:hypothetical protein
MAGMAVAMGWPPAPKDTVDASVVHNVIGRGDERGKTKHKGPRASSQPTLAGRQANKVNG